LQASIAEMIWTRPGWSPRTQLEHIFSEFPQRDRRQFPTDGADLDDGRTLGAVG
jgi:hypothetical protein